MAISASRFEKADCVLSYFCAATSYLVLQVLLENLAMKVLRNVTTLT